MKAEIAPEDRRPACLDLRQVGNPLAGTIWKIILQ